MRESKLWSWHILTAVIILVLLGLHMGIMHLNAVLNVLGIGSDDVPGRVAPVGKRDLDLVCRLDHVVVGEDVAILADNDP